MSKIQPSNAAQFAQIFPRLGKAIFVQQQKDNTVPIHLMIDNFSKAHFELLKREIKRFLEQGKNVEVKVGKTSWYIGKVARTARLIKSWEDYFSNITKRLVTAEINNDIPGDYERTYVIFNAGNVIT